VALTSDEHFPFFLNFYLLVYHT